ncbi:MAG: GxxExxY protein [Planctomycetota bacterium]|jgi:GxxExxY protein
MSTNNKDIIHKDLSYKVVGLAMEVHSNLGFGFLEKVYENALMVLFEKNEIPAQQQVPLRVYFEGKSVGDYYADILVDSKIILELKAVDRIVDAHRA